MILLDTDHCVFFIRGLPSLVEAFSSHAADEPAVSIITVGELYYGAFRSAKPQSNFAKCQAFIQRVNVLGLDEDVILRFARTKAELADGGELIEDPDLLIAATALKHNVPLVTHNISHFRRIPGLRLEDWTG